MNHWLDQKEKWILCFDGFEFPINTEKPKKGKAEDRENGFVLEWWEEHRINFKEDGSKDWAAIYSWAADDLVQQYNGRPIVLCRVNDLDEELEIWTIRDATVTDFKYEKDGSISFYLDLNQVGEWEAL
jgi:hypothetical protein